MILLVEKDTQTRKILCDMLNRERIIGVSSKQQVLEAMVQHRTKLKVFIADAAVLSEILSEETILKLCMKLSIQVPPIIVLYRSEQQAIIKRISNNKYHFEFVEFDQKSNSFPAVYTQAIKKVYPQLHVDMDVAKKVWQKSEESQDLEDVRQWLKQSGFAVEADDKMPKQKQVQTAGKTKKESPADFKKLYLELKEKYDKLVAEFEELKKLFE